MNGHFCVHPSRRPAFILVVLTPGEWACVVPLPLMATDTQRDSCIRILRTHALSSQALSRPARMRLIFHSDPEIAASYALNAGNACPHDHGADPGACMYL